MLIPALLGWHTHHDAALAVVRDRVTAIPVHVLLETYSALTRLPDPRRPSPALARAALRALDRTPLSLPASAHLDAIDRLADAGIGGGATYDGLIAATAAHHGYRLLSADLRARPTYDAVGAGHELVSFR